ncbi:hypothetical protein GOV12_06360 [Candidatus Pacearchaeota archaeon]|nr:hypothetical protein [Candidatus Pacearchaeota archaeon]
MDDETLRGIVERLKGISDDSGEFDLNNFIDRFHEYGFLGITSNTSESIKKGKEGINLYDNPGKDFSKESIYVMDRRISGRRLECSDVRENRVIPYRFISGEEYLQRLEASLSSSIALMHQNTTGGGTSPVTANILLIHRIFSIPIERMKLIDNYIEMVEWSGEGRDYNVPYESESGVLDQSFIGRSGQTTNPLGYVRCGGIGKTPMSEIIVEAYRVIDEFDSKHNLKIRFNRKRSPSCRNH